MEKLFTGRIGRKEWCLYTLFSAIIFVIVVYLAFALFGGKSFFTGPLVLILFILFFILTLSFHIRRLHDLGWNGSRVLLLLVPPFNLFLFLAFIFMKGQDGVNEYGA
ncbi:MAG: DUF805 domain-containing protein [Bacteroidota bacterium]|jgi:uncharacterized membrane protein YhaH (DUF805 family)